MKKSEFLDLVSWIQSVERLAGELQNMRSISSDYVKGILDTAHSFYIKLHEIERVVSE